MKTLSSLILALLLVSGWWTNVVLAGVSGWSVNTNYLERSAAVWPGQLPFMVSAWINWDGTVAAGTAWNHGESSATLDHSRRMTANTSGDNKIYINSRTTANSNAVSTTGVTADTWHHLTGSFIASNSRAAYLDGASKGTEITNRVLNTPTVTRLGVTIDAAFNALPGGLAEVSIWDTAGFTETNRDDLSVKLAAGENPININAEAGQPWTDMLVAYWPLTDTTDINDTSGNGHNLSTVGTLSNFASHPTIDPVTGTAKRTITIVVD